MVKQGTQIRSYGAVDVFGFLNSRDQEFALDHLVEIRKQIGLEVAAAPKEPEERTMTFSKLAEGLGHLKLKTKYLRTLTGTSGERFEVGKELQECLPSVRNL